MAPVNPEPILGQEINLWVAVSFTGHSPVGTVRQVVGRQIWEGWEAFVNVQFHLPIQRPFNTHQKCQVGGCSRTYLRERGKLPMEIGGHTDGL